MKASTTTINIILKALDIELKNLLQQDLERFKTNPQNKQAAIKKAA